MHLYQHLHDFIKKPVHKNRKVVVLNGNNNYCQLNFYIGGALSTFQRVLMMYASLVIPAKVVKSNVTY